VTTSDGSVEERLVFLRDVFINFRTTRQWVLIKLFALPPDTDDHALLQLLIHHERYRDSYAAPEFRDAGTIHGPYWLYAITPELFLPASAADAEAQIRAWAEDAAPLADGDRAALEDEVYPRIAGATGRYQLPDIRAAAEHDWGYVVGSSGFHEFVLIDRVTNSVALLVASDD
jgi:hypothetical protein